METTRTTTTKTNTKFRVALKVALARKGKSQRDLARLLGVKDTTLSGWLTGAHSGPTELRRKIETALRLPKGALAD